MHDIQIMLMNDAHPLHLRHLKVCDDFHHEFQYNIRIVVYCLVGICIEIS
jgi:hypothetical protein